MLESLSLKDKNHFVIAGLDLASPIGANVAGRVTRADTGAPIAGATVQIFDSTAPNPAAFVAGESDRLWTSREVTREALQLASR